MTPAERLELLATLRRGYCRHRTRVNICGLCLAALESIVKREEGKDV